MSSSLKNLAQLIFNTAIKAVDPFTCIINNLAIDSNYLFVGPTGEHCKFNLDKYQSIKVVGCGKAGAPMAMAVEEILKDRIEKGIVVTKYGHNGNGKFSKIEIIEAGHPEPDLNGLIGAQKTYSMLKESDENTLILSIISGGGSALWPFPSGSISLEEKKNLSKLLIECGASIHEINVVRKHVSNIKGGRASQIAYPATIISLLLSDVVGDDPGTIASGPFSPDKSTFKDALAVLEKYKISSLTPKTILDHLKKGLLGEIEETPKPKSKAFEKCRNLMIGSNTLAILAAAKKAEQLGYQPIVIKEPIVGECIEAAKNLCGQLKSLISLNEKKAVCFISGGETTVTLGPEHGKGGRNQEFALVSAFELNDYESIGLLSCGTDGTDGPTDAAGAFIDGRTIKLCRDNGLHPELFLSRHDSYSLFEKIGALVKTGPTQTNVMDLQIFLCNKS